ncbi:MAG: hypothetical protein JW932_16365 [Deltaproteobacteria bacterium]|nr:hypothetical protein [Deltaproteobacteria bacterium]
MSFGFKQVTDGNDDTSMILHLNIFHLLQTISMHTMDLDADVPSIGRPGTGIKGKHSIAGR